MNLSHPNPIINKYNIMSHPNDPIIPIINKINKYNFKIYNQGMANIIIFYKFIQCHQFSNFELYNNKISILIFTLKNNLHSASNKGFVCIQVTIQQKEEIYKNIHVINLIIDINP